MTFELPPNGSLNYSESTLAAFRKNAEELTTLLRTSAELRWRNVREALAKEGVEPGHAAVAELGPDPPGEIGYVVARDGRVFFFELVWVVDWDGRELGVYEDAWVSEWEPRDRSLLYGNDDRTVGAAEALLAAEAADD